MSIVQEVEIAETMVTHLMQGAAPHEVESLYPEIWRRLDAARATAAGLGRDVSAYDRARAGIATGASTDGGPSSRAAGIGAARDAIATFRRQHADLAWSPLPDYGQTDLTPRSNKLLGFIVLLVVFVALGLLRRNL